MLCKESTLIHNSTKDILIRIFNDLSPTGIDMVMHGGLLAHLMPGKRWDSVENIDVIGDSQ
jgi:hypothetical protein